ncbi:hypothetical protein [Pseudomonas phage Astolliot]|nr:hypothetical protein [Pseudomonas phage Astolliot]
MRHKHAEIIKLWVDGAKIQGQSPSTDEWIDVPMVSDLDVGYLDPSPIHPEYDWWSNWRVVAQ